MKTLALLPLLALASLGKANPDAWDSEVKRFRTFHLVPGVSIAIVKDGKIVYSKGYGVADLESGKKVTEGTRFKIASISKPILAVATMMLVEQGKFTLETPVSQLVEGTPESWKPITVRHLLDHTSGLSRECPGFKPFEPAPLIEMVRSAFPLPLEFETGTKYQYSNIGYFTLAAIIERVSGQPFQTFVQERIFKPLGMKETGLTDFYSVIPQRTKGYTVATGDFRNEPDYLTVRPSGAFLSTARDLARFEIGLANLKLVSPATLQRMFTPSVLKNGSKIEYGLGWQVAPDRQPTVLGHGGALPGFRTTYVRIPDSKLAVIVLTNLAENSPNDLALQLASVYVPALKTRPAKEHADQDRAHTSLVANYYRSRLSGKVDETVMTSEFSKKTVSPLEQRRLRGFGSLKSVTRTDPAVLPPNFTHAYRLQFQNITVQAYVRYEGSKIADARLNY